MPRFAANISTMFTDRPFAERIAAAAAAGFPRGRVPVPLRGRGRGAEGAAGGGWRRADPPQHAARRLRRGRARARRSARPRGRLRGGPSVARWPMPRPSPTRGSPSWRACSRRAPARKPVSASTRPICRLAVDACGPGRQDRPDRADQHPRHPGLPAQHAGRGRGRDRRARPAGPAACSSISITPRSCAATSRGASERHQGDHRARPDRGRTGAPRARHRRDQLPLPVRRSSTDGDIEGWVGCEYVPAGRTEDGLGWANRYGIAPAGIQLATGGERV